MTLLVLVIACAVTAAVVAAIVWRTVGPAPPAPPPGPHTAQRAELATGVGLVLALAVVVGGGVLLGVLAYLVRRDSDLVALDESVAAWGDRHASPFATDVLDVITTLGEPTVVVILAAVLAAVETVRTRSRWVVPFVLVVVAGNGILTTTVKHLADRVRPSLNPIAETLGPSFPSGHSSWSIAFCSAAALLLSRGRSRRARTLIAAVAAGLTVAVAGSRVLLDVHWLSDVIAGLALGAAWFTICALAFGGRVLRFGAPAEEAMRPGNDPPVRRSGPSVKQLR